MKENNTTRRRLEALITVFELFEKHEVKVPHAAGALIDTVGQLMLHEIQQAKGWDNTTMSIELIRMEREVARASGQPESPLDGLMEIIMAAMSGGAKVEVVSGDSIGKMLDELRKRTAKSDAGATPQRERATRDGGIATPEGNGATGTDSAAGVPNPEAPAGGLNPAAAWPFGTKD